MNLAPIIPIRRQDAFDDPAYCFELKYDGFRALCDTVNGHPVKEHEPDGTF